MSIWNKNLNVTDKEEELSKECSKDSLASTLKLGRV